MEAAQHKALTNIFSSFSSVEIAWLYGSRAREDHQGDSDYDFAVALSYDSIGDQNLLDTLTQHLSEALTKKVSIVDINKAPTPLAYNIIDQGIVLLCRNNLRLHKEEQRIWSKWEHYCFHHEQQNPN